MTVVAAQLYRQGKRVQALDVDQPNPCSGNASEFAWIGLIDPTEKELKHLQETYGLHPLAVEDDSKRPRDA